MTRTHHAAPAVTTATAAVTTATPRRGAAKRATATGASGPSTPAPATTARRAATPPDAVDPNHLLSDGGPLVFGRMDRAGSCFGGAQ